MATLADKCSELNRSTLFTTCDICVEVLQICQDSPAKYNSVGLLLFVHVLTSLQIAYICVAGCNRDKNVLAMLEYCQQNLQ